MELREKIADYKRRAENKSLPASAVAVLNKKIEEMETELKGQSKTDDNSSVYISPKGKKFAIIAVRTGNPWANETFKDVSEAEKFIKDNNLVLTKKTESAVAKKAPKPKFKKGDSVTEMFPGGETKGEFTVKSSYWDQKTEQNRYNLHIKGSPSAVVDFSESQITRKASKKEMEKAFGKEFMESKDKGAKKEYAPTESHKKSASECDEIIAEAKAKAAKRKKSAQKPEIKKSENGIDKVMDSLKHKFKDGDLTKDQIKTLLTSLRSQISELERLLKVA